MRKRKKKQRGLKRKLADGDILRIGRRVAIQVQKIGGQIVATIHAPRSIRIRHAKQPKNSAARP